MQCSVTHCTVCDRHIFHRECASYSVSFAVFRWKNSEVQSDLSIILVEYTNTLFNEKLSSTFTFGRIDLRNMSQYQICCLTLIRGIIGDTSDIPAQYIAWKTKMEIKIVVLLYVWVQNILYFQQKMF